MHRRLTWSAGGRRNNLSYGRYWEGRTQLQQMTAKLSDAVRASIKWRPPEEEVEEHRWFCDTLVHLISLFHAVALATLRGDYDMENLVVRPLLPPTCMTPMSISCASSRLCHSSVIAGPPEVSRGLHSDGGHTERSEAVLQHNCGMGWCATCMRGTAR